MKHLFIILLVLIVQISSPVFAAPKLDAVDAHDCGVSVLTEDNRVVAFAGAMEDGNVLDMKIDDTAFKLKPTYSNLMKHVQEGKSLHAVYAVDSLIVDFKLKSLGLCAFNPEYKNEPNCEEEDFEGVMSVKANAKKTPYKVRVRWAC